MKLVRDSEIREGKVLKGGGFIVFWDFWWWSVSRLDLERSTRDNRRVPLSGFNFLKPIQELARLVASKPV